MGNLMVGMTSGQRVVVVIERISHPLSHASLSHLWGARNPEFLGHRLQTSMTRATVEGSTRGLGQTLRTGRSLIGGLSVHGVSGICMRSLAHGQSLAPGVGQLSVTHTPVWKQRGPDLNKAHKGHASLESAERDSTVSGDDAVHLLMAPHRKWRSTARRRRSGILFLGLERPYCVTRARRRLQTAFVSCHTARHVKLDRRAQSDTVQGAPHQRTNCGSNG